MGDIVPGPDTNSDGMRSFVGTSQQEVKDLGPFISEETGEFLPPLPAPVTCSKNRLEFPLLYNQGVATQESSGDQLSYAFTSGVLCVNPNTGAFTVEGEALFTGGTGQFAGASGAFTGKSKGQFSLDDSGSQSGKFKRTLILP